MYKYSFRNESEYAFSGWEFGSLLPINTRIINTLFDINFRFSYYFKLNAVRITKTKIEE